MSDYNPAEHAYCHVCGHWVRLNARRLMYRHRYGGASGSDYCVGGRHRVGEIISGFVGPYVRDPRPKMHGDPWWADDYFRGYRAELLHPHSPSTGSEGRCDICGGYSGNPCHAQPWRRLDEPDEMYLSWKRGEKPEPERPQHTDVRFAARMERLAALKAPAVSNRPPGGIGKVVQRFPETAADDERFGEIIDTVPGRRTDSSPPYTSYNYLIQAAKAAEIATNEEDPMNLNITTTTGTVKAVRAYVTSEDGTQGVFAEGDDHAAAIAQAAGAVLSGAKAATFAGYTESPEEDKPGLVFKATAAPIATTQAGIKRIVRKAMERDQYVAIDYTSDDAARIRRTRKVYPLYELSDMTGFVARDGRHGPKTFKWARVASAEEVV